SIEETLTGSYFVHSPPSPRNVGIPLSAETPAPVRARPWCAAARSSAARSTSRKDFLRGVELAFGGVGVIRGVRRDGHPRRPFLLADRCHLEDAEGLRRLALQLQARHLVDGDVIRARLV